MKQKILAVLMIIAVLLCFMPTMAFAQNGAEGESTPDPKTWVQKNDNDLNITKSVVDNEDGTYDLVLEAFATGTSQVTTVSKPLDIVLVLDVSGSMDKYTKTRTYTEQKSKGYSYNSIMYDWTQYYYKDDNGQYYPVYADYAWIKHGRLDWSAEYYLYYRIGNRDYRIGSTATKDNQTIYTGVLYTTTIKEEKKLDSMKAAAKNFVNTVASDAAANKVDHRIAVVKFAGKKSTQIGNHDYTEDGYRHNYSQTVVGLTEAKTGAATLNGGIDALKAAGATQANFGMELANGLPSNTSAGRQKVVILFTDGEPTSTNGFEHSVANAAISAAKTMKDAGTVVYTVGMIAEPSPNVKNFLTYTSSNYPSAQDMDNAGNKTADKYYTIVKDGSDLDDVFQKIANEAVTSAAKADETSLLKDTLSSYFNFKLTDNGDLAKCKVEKVPCTGENVWGTAEAEDITGQVTVRFNGKDIQVSGFDYINDDNLVVEKKADGSWKGHKLVLTFSIVPDPNADWQEGTHNYPTNNTSNSKAGIYTSDNAEILPLPESPEVQRTAAKVTYQVTGDSPAISSAIPAEKVYLVGTSVSVAGNLTTTETTKDGKTGTWTFNGWDRSDNFTMTAENVTITGTWTFTSTDTGTYTVTYKDGMGGTFFTDEVHGGLNIGDQTPAYNNGTAPSHEGYNFIGWEPEVLETVTDNAIYTAKWEEKSNPQPPVEETYTVTYKDGRNETFFEDKVYDNLKKGTPTPKYDENNIEPTHSDYIFKGWKPAVADTVTENATYIAQWESKSEHLIKENLRIEVECVKDGSGHTVEEYDTSVGGYSAITNQDKDGNYTSTITVAASQYIEQYNKDMKVNHRLAAGETETKTIVVKFNGAYENFEIADGALPVVFKVTCGDSELDPTYYTVTYTDGVEVEQVFADQVYSNLKSGDLTPAFDGTPTRAGYKFTGWYPAVAKTVIGNATYVAQWEKESTPPTPTPSVYLLTLTKQVVGLDTVPADYAVTVTITNKYGTVVRTVTLEANKPTPIYLSYGEYTLTETAASVEGYTLSDQAFSEYNFVLNGSKNVTITNTYTKDAEEPPVDPKPTDPKPTNPATPAEQNKPDENPNNVPKTGDDMPISLAIYGIIAASALLGIRKAAKRETK